MSRHDGVSCDSCLKGNFRGRRYKCLVCYDYDLCGACYDAGATTTRHTTEHPMQCILTRNDLEIFYGGESLEQQQAYTCPFCGKMGFTEANLHDHVTSDHTVSTFEVVCPICAAQPGGDPNLITDDFASHLTLEHRSGTSRDLISFLDEPAASRHPARRMVHHQARGVSSGRTRNRSNNMHFSSSSNATSSSSSALSTRDSVDPIAELLSQLSGVRRTNGSNSSTSQLAHIQMQLQLERQQVRAARQQLERLPRRQPQSSNASANNSTNPSSSNQNNNVATSNSESTGAPPAGQKQLEFLLPKYLKELEKPESEVDLDKLLEDLHFHSFYVQEMLFASLRYQIRLGPNPQLEPMVSSVRIRINNQPVQVNLQQPPGASDEAGVTNISVGDITPEPSSVNASTASSSSCEKKQVTVISIPSTSSSSNEGDVAPTSDKSDISGRSDKKGGGDASGRLIGCITRRGLIYDDPYEYLSNPIGILLGPRMCTIREDVSARKKKAAQEKEFAKEALRKKKEREKEQSANVQEVTQQVKVSPKVIVSPNAVRQPIVIAGQEK